TTAPSAAVDGHVLVHGAVVVAAYRPHVAGRTGAHREECVVDRGTAKVRRCRLLPGRTVSAQHEGPHSGAGAVLAHRPRVGRGGGGDGIEVAVLRGAARVRRFHLLPGRA